MMSRGGNARHPDDCRLRRRRRSRRCQSRHPYRPGTDRCCRNSPPSGPDTRLEVGKGKHCFSTAEAPSTRVRSRNETSNGMHVATMSRILMQTRDMVHKSDSVE